MAQLNKSPGHWEVSRKWVPSPPKPVDSHSQYNENLKQNLHKESIARRTGAGHRPPTRSGPIPTSPAVKGDPAAVSAAECGAQAAAMYKSISSVKKQHSPAFGEGGVSCAWNPGLKKSSESPLIADPLVSVFQQVWPTVTRSMFYPMSLLVYRS